MRRLARLAALIPVLIVVSYAAQASPFIVTVDVQGDTAIIGTDPSNIFGQGFSLPTAPGAFAYDAKFSFDLANLNLTSPRTTLPLFGSYVGQTNATFTALGRTFSISSPSGGLSLTSIAGSNFYAQQAASGTASLDVSVNPAALGNPIKTAGLAGSFSYAPPPSGDPLTRTIFTSGSTSLIANVNSITYSGPGCASVVNSAAFNLSTSGRSLTFEPVQMRAKFQPAGMTLDQAANACGYLAFDWQQKIVGLSKNGAPVQSPFHANDNPSVPLNPPFSDPVKSGYVEGEKCGNVLSSRENTAFPFYYYTDSNPPLDCYALANHENGGAFLDFSDLPGISGGPTISLETALVGVLLGNKASSPIHLWDWQTDFNPGACLKTGDPKSCLGGILVTDFPLTPDEPVEGTGGIKILSIDGVPASSNPSVPEPNPIIVFCTAMLAYISLRYIVVCGRRSYEMDSPNIT